MGSSVLRTTGRWLAPVVAVALLAGVSQEAQAYGAKGTIFFETGKTLTNFRFVYAPGGGPDAEDFQTFEQLRGCITRLDPESPAQYVVLEGNAALGYMATSIGVYDGPQGTACGRVSEAKSEWLKLTLAGGLPNEANAFDRLELDLEVKGDVVLQLDVQFDERVVSYYLESGAGVAPSDADPTKVFNCRLDTDSGPDSGPSDNCNWVINEIGKSFTITPRSGEFSLEGGGDYSDVRANSTKIFLTQTDGIYDCGDTITSADTAMSCSVTRLDPGDGVACTPVPYVFRTNGGACTLTVDPQGQQLVANLLVSYQPELSKGESLDRDNWPAADLSKVKFDTSDTVFNIPACRGFTLAEEEIEEGVFVFPGAFPEIDDVPDWVGGGFKEFACAYLRLEEFRTNADTDALETWITEGIQFWGDVKFSRAGD